MVKSGVVKNTIVSFLVCEEAQGMSLRDVYTRISLVPVVGVAVDCSGL